VQNCSVYTIDVIAKAVEAKPHVTNGKAVIKNLLTDSRRIVFPANSLFFALHSSRRDGFNFIEEVFKQGVTNFVTTQLPDVSKYPNANFLLVKDTLQALQQLAAWHRSHFHYPVIGITGSNGKTIVKEWLYQLLSPEYNIIRSPRSYNSQIGVPLSVWQMSSQHNLAIFEAGISLPGEMKRLEHIIQPTSGILTNIGEAHQEGFESVEQKVKEKLQLFTNTEILFFNMDNMVVNESLSSLPIPQPHGWGLQSNADLYIQKIEKQLQQTSITALYKQSEKITIIIPFTDDASIENAITCWNVCLYFKLSHSAITERMAHLQAIDMRLQLLKAINGCSVINDSYSFDINSFNIALDFLLQQHQYPSKSVIISDFAIATDDSHYYQVADVLAIKKINRIITIGENWYRLQNILKDKIGRTTHFISMQSYLNQLHSSQFRNEIILLKGARKFGFERIVGQMEDKVHSTVMEINLTALAHNLKAYQHYLQQGTRLMAMIKAGGYGSGSAEVANVLQYHKVDYLAVAYADEGVELRKAGISLPILVLNVDEAAFEAIIDNNLEPELFSPSILKAFNIYLFKQGIQQYPVHIKLDTGMHRLGFEEKDMPELIVMLTNTHNIAIKSVFTHLAASEDEKEDAFTRQQYDIFNRCCNRLQKALKYNFIKHIANSAAIFRHPAIQLDMVRLGIGLYGVDSANEHQLQLQTVCTLKTTIAQLRWIKAGDTVGYNRRGKVNKDELIATLRIGYADGVSRRLSNGVGSVWIKGKLAPIIGNICMDMLMVVATGIEGVQEGDEAEVFGKNIPVQEVAKQCGTIPYEILTGISQRVKRIYIEE
jgi:alanine racemase